MGAGGQARSWRSDPGGPLRTTVLLFEWVPAAQTLPEFSPDDVRPFSPLGCFCQQKVLVLLRTKPDPSISLPGPLSLVAAASAAGVFLLSWKQMALRVSSAKTLNHIFFTPVGKMVPEDLLVTLLSRSPHQSPPLLPVCSRV